MTVHWISLGCEDVIVGFGKCFSTLSPFFWHFMDQTEKIIDRLIDNENAITLFFQEWRFPEIIQMLGSVSLYCQLVCAVKLTGLEKTQIQWWQWLMAVLCVRNLNNTKKRQENELRCEPFVSGDRAAVVSHHCPWSPFALNKQIQSSFQHSREWWRGACLYFVRLLMESLTVRGYQGWGAWIQMAERGEQRILILS